MNQVVEPLEKAWKTVTRDGVKYYAEGPHSGKEYGKVREKNPHPEGSSAFHGFNKDRALAEHTKLAETLTDPTKQHNEFLKQSGRGKYPGTLEGKLAFQKDLKEKTDKKYAEVRSHHDKGESAYKKESAELAAKEKEPAHSEAATLALKHAKEGNWDAAWAVAEHDPKLQEGTTKEQWIAWAGQKLGTGGGVASKVDTKDDGEKDKSKKSKPKDGTSEQKLEKTALEDRAKNKDFRVGDVVEIPAPPRGANEVGLVPPSPRHGLVKEVHKNKVVVEIPYMHFSQTDTWKIKDIANILAEKHKLGPSSTPSKATEFQPDTDSGSAAGEEKPAIGGKPMDKEEKEPAKGKHSSPKALSRPEGGWATDEEVAEETAKERKAAAKTKGTDLARPEGGWATDKESEIQNALDEIKRKSAQKKHERKHANRKGGDGPFKSITEEKPQVVGKDTAGYKASKEKTDRDATRHKRQVSEGADFDVGSPKDGTEPKKSDPYKMDDSELDNHIKGLTSEVEKHGDKFQDAMKMYGIGHDETRKHSKAYFAADSKLYEAEKAKTSSKRNPHPADSKAFHAYNWQQAIKKHDEVEKSPEYQKAVKETSWSKDGPPSPESYSKHRDVLDKRESARQDIQQHYAKWATTSEEDKPMKKSLDQQITETAERLEKLQKGGPGSGIVGHVKPHHTKYKYLIENAPSKALKDSLESISALSDSDHRNGGRDRRSLHVHHLLDVHARSDSGVGKRSAWAEKMEDYLTHVRHNGPDLINPPLNKEIQVHSKSSDSLLKKGESAMSNDPREQLKKSIAELGPDELRDRLPTLEKAEQVLLLEVLGEMKKASPNFDANYAGTFKPKGKITDTEIQEDRADDDQDEKLVLDAAGTINHQGDTTPEGRTGQGISDDGGTETPQVSTMQKSKLTPENIEILNKSLPAMQLFVEKLCKAGKTDTEILEASGQNGLNVEQVVAAMEENDKLVKSEPIPAVPTIQWSPENALFKARTGGRNHAFSINGYYDDILALDPTKAEIQPLAKSCNLKDTPINEILEKGLDRSADSIAQERLAKAQSALVTGHTITTYAENDLASILGLTPEQALKILG